MSQIQEVFLFQPTQISGCQLWLDATDPNGTGTPPANGSTLSTWKDKSSNGFSGTAVNSPVFRTNIQNQLPGIQFNGTNQYINFGNVVNLGSSQIFAFAVTQFTGDGSIVAKSSLRGFAARWFLIRYAGDGGMEFGADATGSGVIAPFVDTTTTPQLLMGSWDRTTVATFQNGTQKATASLSNSSSLSNSDILLVGAYGNSSGTGPQGGFYLNGFINEILVFLTDMTTFQRQQIEGYLAWKWGLQGLLPSSHPFKTYRPLRTGAVPTSIPPMPITNQNSGIFLPTQISNCILWLDAADTNTLTFSGLNVTQWRDKALGATASNILGTGPTSSTLNSLNALNFDGTKIMKIDVNQSTTNRTFFMVMNSSSTSGAFIWPTSASGFEIQSYSANTLVFANQNIAYIRISPTIPSGSPYIVTISYAGAPSTIFSINGDGTGTDPGQTGSLSLASDNTHQIGGTSGYTATFILGEIIEYNSTLSTAQRQQVEGYLAWKWGLVASLPASHPYKQPYYAFSYRPTPIVYSSSTWQPTRISGMSLWLDAADPNANGTKISSGATITTWKDKSGNGNNVTGSSGTTTYITNGISSLGSVYFNSSFFTGGFNANFTGTVIYSFIVASINSNSTQYSRLLSLGRPGVNDFDSVSTCIPFVRNTGLNQLYSGNNNVATAKFTITYGSPFLSQTYFNSTSIGNNLNGGSFNTVGTTCAFNLTSYGLGINTNTADIASLYVGEICEVICYFGTSLTTQQAQQVEGYLAWKWGLVSSLPANHPYKLWPPSP